MVEFLYLFYMKFEYDPKKSASNKVKHGIDFEEAKSIWKDIFAIIIPAKVEGEPRYAIIGAVFEKLWTAIFTPRGEFTRIISCRRSRDEEKAKYEKEKNR